MIRMITVLETDSPVGTPPIGQECQESILCEVFGYDLRNAVHKILCHVQYSIDSNSLWRNGSVIVEVLLMDEFRDFDLLVSIQYINNGRDKPYSL
ncbi:hypothetical protein QQZ08_007440 [Neonectria magnoliae]|uniref:Uncharacterized protein n=1 Tax=Neonectria magnoliae TaxID=2732573 RepID=A0ABR1HXX5_9HYPO